MTVNGNFLTRTFAAVLTAAKSFLAIPFFNTPARVRTNLLKSMRLLADETFACFIAPEYKDYLYLYERRVHKAKMLSWYWLSRLTNEAIHADLATILKILIDMGMLRFRVTDYTVFGFCRDEMISLQEDISSLLAKLNDHEVLNDELERYMVSIQQFENCFEQVMKVSAKEPAVFILFIGSLRNLQKVLGVASDEA